MNHHEPAQPLPAPLPAHVDASTNPVLVSQELATLPVIMMTSWWNAVVDNWWPAPPHLPHGETHELCVPEPIETTGEHALFA